MAETGSRRDEKHSSRIATSASSSLPLTLGYCTNVHAGATIEQTQANLDRFATAVRAQYRPNEPLPIGLWLSAKAARALLERDELPRFRDWLDERQLRVFTINGFPHGDFHQPVVKHKVYQPMWSDLARLNYTRDLINILAALLPEGSEGSISTLPIGWAAAVSPRDQHAAASLIHDAVKIMADVEHWQHKFIHLDFEPEPGCLLQRSDDVIAYFRRYLFSHPSARLARRHLRICHDICHAAVMFEDQAEMFRRYDAIGATIGKVQVSSAIRVDFDSLPHAQREQAFASLRSFQEDRYLHQVMIRMPGQAKPTFFEDLPDALLQAKPAGEWRVHFHVPIYLDSVAGLGSTQHEIGRCFALLRERAEVRHFEVETYAWNVLPDSLIPRDLSAGIARELDWARTCLERGGDLPASDTGPSTTPARKKQPPRAEAERPDL